MQAIKPLAFPLYTARIIAWCTAKTASLKACVDVLLREELSWYVIGYIELNRLGSLLDGSYRIRSNGESRETTVGCHMTCVLPKEK